MLIKKIQGLDIGDAAAVDQAFESLEPQPVACCNLPDDFPYAPEVYFRMFHTGNRLFLRFDVEEEYTAAKVAEDNGEVWTDSCVEFFISAESGLYYNFETTCIGRMLLGARRSKTDFELAAPKILGSIGRRTSFVFGETFDEKHGENRWSLTLSIPPTALFRSGISDWSGVDAEINLYKCGDNLTKPHFLSWKPIKTETPDFHRPEYFGSVHFE